ncbi:Arc family DNA-binding protein [Massilia sp. RP-1-19]|uniref:Arc family DNA-binding protein n=1 Tax=Massilia polaris TaxID=2728846 RepID=A0A848HQ59_9BURK|nr:Arc family DNA-binding protein [Massilia polaris]NML62249.1 Arc family DNA-binding protein [Massilia polaris]
MSKKPEPTTSQENYVHSGIRMPPELKTALKEAAVQNGRSLNAEILARLQANPLEPVLADLAELKQMVRKVLSQI